MHVDGFRFDLASALARDVGSGSALRAFFDIIHQDPVLSQVKLIAEPWDLGPNGLSGGQFSGALDRVEWQVSRLCPAFLERPRRHRWRTCLATRRQQRSLSRTMAAARAPASISSPRTTDSPSRDLVSYNDKHNEANGEENRDGTDDNDSWNCGAEGPDGPAGSMRCAPASSAISSPRCSSRKACRCSSPATNSARPSTATTMPIARIHRSRGSIGTFPPSRSTCSTLSASDAPAQDRARFPPPPLFPGPALHGPEIKDIYWIKPDGTEMSGVLLGIAVTRIASAWFATADQITELSECGKRIEGDTFAILFNAHHEPVPFRLCTPGVTSAGLVSWIPPRRQVPCAFSATWLNSPSASAPSRYCALIFGHDLCESVSQYRPKGP